jgi:hypothetical protein
MSDIEITLRLPQTLVERAQSEGVVIDDANIAKLIEAEFVRVEAARFLRDAMQKLEGSMTLEEIESELESLKSQRIIS